jgi:transposase-like protein
MGRRASDGWTATRVAAVNPRTAIRTAATARGTADRRLKAAVIGAHGTLTIAEIARVAGVTRQTVYTWLHESGIETPRQ